MPPIAARPPLGRPLIDRLPGLFAQTRHALGRLRRRLIWPTPPEPVFHVTHHKAGSQWIRRILEELATPWVVSPRADSSQFLSDPIQPRRVYPSVYVTREQFERIASPPNSRRFVIIRDLRDTLVSAYFSFALSHETTDPQIAEYRARLKGLTKENALIRMIREVCQPIASIQRSWLDGRDEILKYEDLLKRDEEILARVLLDRCGLPVSRHHFAKVVAANRFEARTGGRKPGAEDRRSHERKGVAGDWRNHFTDRIAKAFKEHYGDLLIAAGYERDDRW